jgi:hypothetical protein
LLCAGGEAYETLTGEYGPPCQQYDRVELAGEPWTDDELPSRFPLAWAMFR